MLNYIKIYQNLRLFLVAFIFLIFTSCEKTGEIGSNLIDSSLYLSSHVTDTLTVKTSTVFLDSVITAHTYNMLVGSYNDSKLGRLKVRTYFDIASFADSITTATPIIDSAKVILLYHNPHASVGDTTKNFTLNFHELEESLDPDRKYISTNSLSYSSQPLMSYTFKPSPITYKNNQKDTIVKYNSLTINMSERFSNRLVEAAKNRSGNQFKKVFKGIALVADEASSILGFSASSSALIIYYRDGTVNKSLLLSLTAFNSAGTQFLTRFSEFIPEKKPPLNLLTKKGDALPSSQSDMINYIQMGTGLGVKIEFPYLEEIRKRGKIAVNQAVLTLSPVLEDSYSLVGTRFSVAEIGVDNQPIKQTNTLWKYLSPELSLTEFQVIYNKTDKNYTLNLSTPFHKSLNKGTNPKMNLLLLQPFTNPYESTGGTFGAAYQIPLHGDASFKLKLHYSVLK